MAVNKCLTLIFVKDILSLQKKVIMSNQYTILILVILLTLSCKVIFSQEWKLKENDDNIEVFTRPVDGSSMEEFKGIALIDARFEVVTELLRDIPSFHDWMYCCKETKAIEEIDRNNKILYYIYDSPWPVDDRDVVLKINTIIDLSAGRAVVEIQSQTHDKYPPNDDYTRMITMQGKYIIEFVERQKTRVTFILFVNPGGSVPASLANMSSIKIPYETLKNMKEMVKKEKYIKLGDKSEDKKLIEQYISKQH